MNPYNLFLAVLFMFHVALFIKDVYLWSTAATHYMRKVYMDQTFRTWLYCFVFGTLLAYRLWV